MEALKETNFTFPGQKSFQKGKIRDIYNISDQYLILVTSDRISAFDIVLNKGIPYKGQVLNQIAALFLDETKDIVPNWKISTPDPMVTIGKYCKPFPVEMVIRGYLSGHAWREYRQGKRTLCGVLMPDGMKENDPFPTPLITPTTKAQSGHDEDISKEEIIKSGLVASSHYEELEFYTRELFSRGQQKAKQQGLILVDTKYEFGLSEEKIHLIDEIHTPDSSRYFYANGYEERQKNGEKQKQLSKEFVREWLMENDFQGKPGQQQPEMPNTFINQVSERYIELYESITGKEFKRHDTSNLSERIAQNIMNFLNNNQ